MKQPDDPSALRPAPLVSVALALCLAGVVLFGAWPSPLLEGAQGASAAFLTARQAATLPAQK